MLQQTQVDRVALYYERFLKAFPSVRALARAPLDDVLKQWEGLGYYGRARSLVKAARVIAERPDAAIPATVEGLRELPGFGPYTAAAVASIAFGVAVPALDTNVLRVLARLFAVDGAVTEAATRRRLETHAHTLLDSARPGDFNQAMMELGAMVCGARSPRCLLCPVSRVCRARALGDPARWPAESPKARRPMVHAACAIVERNRKWLVVQRPETGLLGGLWEFPGARMVDGESPEAACVRGVLEKTGVTVRPGAPLVAVRHTFSHFHVTLHAIVCRAPRGRIAHERAAWRTFDEIDALALTRTARKVLTRLRDVNERRKSVPKSATPLR